METTTEGSGGESSEPRLIKRYANRKLYDTRDSRYVTLQQIAELVRDGEDVKIIDNKSKEDLTNVTLAQIIYEEEKKGDSDVKRSTLLSFIQDGQKRLIDSLPAGLSKLVRPDGKVEIDGEVSVEAPAEGEKRDGEKRASKGAFESIGELKGLADDRVKAILGGAMGHVQQLQGEVRRLQGRIEDLEQKLASLLNRKGEAKSEAPPEDADDEEA